jgi:hypothetical protein
VRGYCGEGARGPRATLLREEAPPGRARRQVRRASGRRAEESQAAGAWVGGCRRGSDSWTRGRRVADACRGAGAWARALEPARVCRSQRLGVWGRCGWLTGARALGPAAGLLLLRAAVRELLLRAAVRDQHEMVGV